MAKYKYTNEYELNAAAKMIYPYLSTPVGLKEWFAEDVQTIDEKRLDIVWDGVTHHAQIVSWRANSHIKYKFEEGEEASTLEFKIEFSEMTQTTFLKVTDYSDMEESEELDDLWDSLVDTLKERLGDAS